MQMFESPSNQIRNTTPHERYGAYFDDSDITQYVKWAKQCSVIVLVKDSNINTININLADENNEHKIISNLVYNTNGRDVDTTIIKGKILMENRKIKVVDSEKIIKKFKEKII